MIYIEMDDVTISQKSEARTSESAPDGKVIHPASSMLRDGTRTTVKSKSTCYHTDVITQVLRFWCYKLRLTSDWSLTQTPNDVTKMAPPMSRIIWLQEVETWPWSTYTVTDLNQISWSCDIEETQEGSDISRRCSTIVSLISFQTVVQTQLNKRRLVPIWADLMETMCTGSYSFQSVFAPRTPLSPHATATVYWRLARNPNTPF